MRISAVVLAAALSCSLQAEWPMFGRNIAHHSFNSEESVLTPESTVSLTPVWTRSLGAPISAAPTVVQGTIYVGAWDGNFHAIDTESGEIRWTTFVGKSPTPQNPACFPATGVAAQATVVDDLVYIGGGDASVYALDKQSGEIRWRYQLGDPEQGAFIWASSTVLGRDLYIGLASLADCPLVRGAIARFPLDDPMNPRIQTLVPEGEEGAGVWQTPAIDPDRNMIYAATGTGDQDTERGIWGGTVLALTADTLDVKAHYLLPSNSKERDIEWGSAPALFHDRDGRALLGVTGKDGVFYALNRDDLSEAWTTKISVECICPECGCGSLSTPAFDGTTVYVGAGVPDMNLFESGSVYALEPADGAVKWFRPLLGTVIAPVTLAGGVVFVGTTRGLEALHGESGEPLWSDGDRGVIYSQPVVSNGTVYTTYVNGEIVAWKPGPAPGE
jgi:outer membrane protein assembly factor BamB